MIKIPRIALFAPDDSSAQHVSALFKRDDYSVRTVSQLDEILHLIEEEGDGFDAFVVPLVLKGKASGPRICMQLKAEESLASTPIVGLATHADKSQLESFYEFGADVVISSALDSDSIFLQISSLGRMRKAFGQELNKLASSLETNQEMLRALDLVQDPLLIFKHNFELFHLNLSAAFALGINSKPSRAQSEKIEQFFTLYLKEYLGLIRNRYDINPTDFATEVETTYTRADGQLFKSVAQITSLIGERKEPRVFIVRLVETAQFNHLADILMHRDKAKSLCLLSTAACIKLIESAYLGSGVSVLRSTEDFINGLPLNSNLSTVLTRLLEFLDLIVSHEISVRVNVAETINLAMRSTDLSQLLGHLFLHAVEFNAGRGEVSVECEEEGESQAILMVNASSPRSQPYIPNGYLAALLEGQYSQLPDAAVEGAKLSFGLKAAQKLADQYRTAIELRNPSENTIKLRVRLPLLRKAAVSKP